MIINRMKIAFLMTGIGYGGASKSLMLLLREIKKKVDIFEIYVFTPFSVSIEIEQDIRNNCDKFVIWFFPQLNYNQAYKTSNRQFRKILKHDYCSFVDEVLKHNIDILYINSTTLAYLLEFFKDRSPHIKIITHLREVIPEPNTNPIALYLINRITRYSDVIISISENEKACFYDQSKIIILPNPVELSNELIHKKVQNNLGIQENDFLIGMMGAFNISKGHLVFLRAINIVNSRITNKKIKSAILGVNRPQQNLKTYLKRLLGLDYWTSVVKYIWENKLNENVLLIPPTYDVESFISQCDIYIRPSLSADPWGRDIIEALALKKPVIATGSSEFYVKNGITGFLVPPNNPEAIANKILELIKDDKMRKKLGQNGYNLVKDMCDVSKYCDQIIDIFKKLA